MNKTPIYRHIHAATPRFGRTASHLQVILESASSSMLNHLAASGDLLDIFVR
jgi:hypothetical protein